MRVFGHSRPCAATIGNTSIEVRLPGMPPMQCLSTTSGSRQSRRRPLATIASVGNRLLRGPVHRSLQATTRAVSSDFRIAMPAISRTMAETLPSRAFAVDLAEQRAHRLRRFRLRNCYQMTVVNPELYEASPKRNSILQATIDASSTTFSVNRGCAGHWHAPRPSTRPESLPAR